MDDKLPEIRNDWERISEEAKADVDYQTIISSIKSASSPNSAACREYKSIWHLLSLTTDGLIAVDGSAFLVPRGSRKDILRKLHASHSGEAKTIENALQLYYWSGMRNDIRQMITGCLVCRKHLPRQQKQKIQVTPETSHAMNTVAIDFFDYGGRKHLVMIDRFSGFPWVKHMRYTTLKDTTTTLLDWFYDWGFPQKIMSDNGPPFQQSFATFCTKYNMQHVTSSPYHPQANGLAEAAVKSMKMLIKKCDETGENFHLALLEWRNTPREDGFSPAQALFGRRQKSLLPSRPEALLPIDVEKFMATRRATRQKQTAAYDKLRYMM